MNILVTGANGFIGRNLCAALECASDGRDGRPRLAGLRGARVLEVVRGTPDDDLAAMCAEADFVVHLAGVNRPADGDFSGNWRSVERLVAALEAAGNACPVALASSAQADAADPRSDGAYAESKREAERVLRRHAARAGAEALVFRLPNVFGKWARPGYNSAVATFCDAVANGRPYRVDDPGAPLSLLYVDDLVECLMDAALGRVLPGEDGLCHAGPVHGTTVGEVAGMLEGFRASAVALEAPLLPPGSLAAKLHATYVSHVEPASLARPLRTSADARGSFTELLRTPDRGQVSVNVVRPGRTKGNHWHHTKWERFYVVSGEALVRERRVGTDAEGRPFPTAEFRLSGDSPTSVDMAPGRTHSITNLSETDDLVFVIWASEPFDPDDPDTFLEEV